MITSKQVALPVQHYQHYVDYHFMFARLYKNPLVLDAPTRTSSRGAPKVVFPCDLQSDNTYPVNGEQTIDEMNCVN